MRSYRDLKVWREAYGLAVDMYEATAGFPREERYGLSQQMRSAAVSVASNIAEGAGRWTPGEYRNFLSMASGSASELECQLLLSKELGYLRPERTNALLARLTAVRRMLQGLIRSLRDHPKPKPQP